MKLLTPLPLIALVGITTVASQAATLIDDFSGSLTNYTNTVILDANGGANNTASWQISGGGLQLNTTAWNGIQQAAYTYNGLSLLVGQELQVDITSNTASQDLGLYVGGTLPVAGVRQDYVAIYARGSNSFIYSRGFDGTTEYALAGPNVAVTYTSLFIARTATNTYELGYYNGVTRNLVTTRTPTTANDAEFVGFYSDVRAVGTLGTLDNLRVVPEPSAVLLGGIGLLGLLRRRRG
ncbi:MAG: PEP-CTERM sorting domain-containing protein [Verrucomicrobiota bacterium]